MSDAYKSTYPSGVLTEPDVVKFFESFYQISDTPDVIDQYVDLFTEDATFLLGSKKATGHADIIPLRQGMWATVKARKHTVPKIFPFGSASTEFMLYGTVSLVLKNGESTEVDWAGRAELEQSASDRKWRMKFYQVFLDTGAYKK